MVQPDARIDQIYKLIVRQKLQYLSDEQKFDNWQNFGDTHHCNTPLMWWIWFHPASPIPTELLFETDVSKLNTLHLSAAMIFIDRAATNIEVPKFLRYDADPFQYRPDWRQEKSRYGETPIYIWCNRTKFLQEPPQYLRYPGWQICKHNDEYLIIKIIKSFINNGQFLPRWLFTDDELKKPFCNKKTPLQFLIKEGPPEIINFIELFTYEGWQRDKDENGYTPIQIWIRTKVDQPIPDILKYVGWEKYKNIYNGDTTLHLWVLTRIGNCQNILNMIPHEILFKDCQTIRNKTGNTPLMEYIHYEEYDLDELQQTIVDPTQKFYGPEALFYNNWVQDVNNNQETMLMLWAQNIFNFSVKAIPDVFRELGEQYIKLRDKDGYTAVMDFICCQEEFTADNLYDQTVPEGITYTGWQWDTDFNGNTPIMLFICNNYNKLDELPPVLLYNETIGAPEDWRLHRNNFDLLPIDVYLEKVDKDLTTMPNNLKSTLTHILQPVQNNICDICYAHATEVNTLYMICDQQHCLCEKCLMERLCAPKCPKCGQKLLQLNFN